VHETADAVVIGGGSVGCSVAYNLARGGVKKVVILEKGYLNAGSTGRCAAGIRQQWGTRINCLMGMGSVERFKRFSEEVWPESIDFRQSGYLLLGHTESEARQLSMNVQLQRSLGIPVEVLTGCDAGAIVPFLNTTDVSLATFCPEDGFVDPFKVTLFYAKAATHLGATLRRFTEVTSITSQGGRVRSVKTNNVVIDTPVVVNATEAYAASLGALAGLNHPVKPERHQILVTEQVEPLLGPMVMSFYHKSYCQQSPNGSFLMGFGNPCEPAGINYKSSLDFVTSMARKAVQLMPLLGSLRVVRQWAGHYGISPDGQPIIGPSPRLRGYYTALGCGKGFMFSPMIGEIVSQMVVGEETTLPAKTMSEERFAKGELIMEPAVV
jgi:sarcosine oxidase subunit beta